MNHAGVAGCDQRHFLLSGVYLVKSNAAAGKVKRKTILPNRDGAVEQCVPLFDTNLSAWNEAHGTLFACLGVVAAFRMSSEQVSLPFSFTRSQTA